MFSRSDLDELVAMDARPAVSIYLPTHVAGREVRQDPIRLKNLLSAAAERLKASRRLPEINRVLQGVPDDLRHVIGGDRLLHHGALALAGLLPATAQDEARPALRELDGRRATDAAGSARDEYDLAHDVS